MRPVSATHAIAWLLVLATSQIAMAAWKGDIIYPSNSAAMPQHRVGIAVAEFDFSRPMNGFRDGTAINKVAVKFEQLSQMDCVTGYKDAITSPRTILMYDEDTVLVLNALYYGKHDVQRFVWITQVEYDAKGPCENKGSGMDLSDIRPDTGTTTGGSLTGRLRLACRPENAWTSISSKTSIPARQALATVLEEVPGTRHVERATAMLENL